MEDAISREEMKYRLRQIRSRTTQWKQSSFRAGFLEAIDHAASAVESCRQVEGVIVTRCKDCRHATDRHSTLPYCTIHNKHKDPNDYCNFGDPDEI